VLQRFAMTRLEDLFVAVGEGNLTGADVVTAVFDSNAAIKPPQRKGSKAAGGNGATAEAIPIRGLIPGMAVHFARCCHPLPGDRIVGIITTGKGVTIHTIDCATLESFSDSPERWIDVGWDAVGEGAAAYTGRLKITVANQPGSLSSLSTVIARHEGNISNLRIVNRSMDFFDMVIDVEVSDVKHLADITAALRATPAINAVERARN
jgi:GTP pyrophosphokinase